MERSSSKGTWIGKRVFQKNNHFMLLWSKSTHLDIFWCCKTSTSNSNEFTSYIVPLGLRKTPHSAALSRGEMLFRNDYRGIFCKECSTQEINDAIKRMKIDKYSNAQIWISHQTAHQTANNINTKSKILIRPYIRNRIRGQHLTK